MLFQCSRSCDKGEKFRLVQCVDVMSTNVHIVGEHLCTGSKKPTPNKICNKQPCPFIWKVGDWSAVSITQHPIAQLYLNYTEFYNLSS